MIQSTKIKENKLKNQHTFTTKLLFKWLIPV